MQKTSLASIWVLTTEYASSIIGGLGTVATELAQALNKSHVKVSVITKGITHSARLTRNNGILIASIPRTKQYYNHTVSSYKLTVLEKLGTRFFSKKPDIIHVHSIEFARAALFLKRKHQIPIVYTCHSLIYMETRRRSSNEINQAYLLRNADQIIVPSLWLKNEILKRYSRSASRIIVIPNGVRIFSEGSHVPPHKLLFVGRLIRDKGIEPLIRSISILAAKNKKISLTIIGKGSPRYGSHLKAIAREKGITSHIHWRGFLPPRKLQQLYASFGSVIIPSRRESFCLVALEAMANGIPLVSTRAGGLKEFVNQENAQIIKAVNTKAISKAIEAVWDHPRLTRRKRIHAKSVAKRYSWQRMATGYKTVFMRLKRRRASHLYGRSVSTLGYSLSNKWEGV